MIQRGESLTILACRKLEGMILSGEIRPGERLNEHHFAVENGLSRGPVREACRLLERAGLLVQIPAKGVFVREISDRHLDETYDLRAVLIGLMCREAAARATDSTCDALAALNARMRAASAAHDHEAYHEANFRFHDMIAEIAGNETAKRVYDGLVKETHAHRVAAKSLEESIAEHEVLIGLLRSGDREAARRVGEAHVLAGKYRWHERRDAAVAPFKRGTRN